MMNALSEFHFLRPGWLVALLLLVPMIWMGLKNHRAAGAWRRLCDAHLLPHLITDGKGHLRRWPLAVSSLVWVATCVALAGPAWERLPQPAYRSPEQRVIVLNLSQSMNATDVGPSRLARARYKLEDALNAAGDAQIGLVIFAEEPYVVTPISDDPRIIKEFIPVLESSLMPGRGARVDRAIEQAQLLLEQSGAVRGGIVLLTDAAGDRPDAAVQAARNATRAGFDVSVLGIGNPDPAQLEAIARAGDGRFASLTPDDRDIDRVMNLGGTILTSNTAIEKTEFEADVWNDMGIVLVWIVVLLAPLAFRRGWAAQLVLLAMIAAGSTIPATAQAALDDWMWRRDQQGAEAFEKGEHAAAAELFEDPDWRAASLYREGRYDEAAAVLADADTPNRQYNLGNSLAHAGKLERAIASYDRALEADPDNEDAKYNRDLVAKLLEDQKKQQEQQQDQQGQQGQQEQQTQQNQQDQPGQQEQQNQQGQQGQRADASEQDSSQASEDSKPDASQASQAEDSSDSEGQGEEPGQEQASAADNPAEQDAAGESSEAEGSDASASNAQAPEEPASEAESSQSASAESRAAGSEPSDTAEPAEQDRLADQPAAGSPGNRGEPADEPASETPKGPSSAMASQPLSERDQAVERWLNRVSEDPGGLLREKLRRRYAQRRYLDATGGQQ